MLREVLERTGESGASTTRYCAPKIGSVALSHAAITPANKMVVRIRRSDEVSFAASIGNRMATVPAT